MYKSFYRLNRKPFEARPDASFFWFGDKLKEVIAAVQEGVAAGKGLHLITGDEGVGKSTVVQAIVDGCAGNVHSAVIDNPGTNQLFFYNTICSGFDLGKEITSKVQFLIEFSHFLRESDVQGSKVLLVIDNAQRLSQEMLEDVRMLSNIEKDEGKLINIVLVGRSKLAAVLSQSRNRVLRQRLSYQADIKPLDQEGVKKYIQHRLAAAGGKPHLFTETAAKLIHKLTGGIPGRINAICDQALTLATEKDLAKIDVEVVKHCVRQEAEAEDEFGNLLEPVGTSLDDRESEISVVTTQFKNERGDDSEKVQKKINITAGFPLKLILVGIICALLLWAVSGLLFNDDSQDALTTAPQQDSAPIVVVEKKNVDMNTATVPVIKQSEPVKSPERSEDENAVKVHSVEVLENPTDQAVPPPQKPAGKTGSRITIGELEIK